MSFMQNHIFKLKNLTSQSFVKIKFTKETVRRKVLELEKMGVLKRKKKQIFIDRSVFSHVKPSRQIGFTSNIFICFVKS